MTLVVLLRALLFRRTRERGKRSGVNSDEIAILLVTLSHLLWTLNLSGSNHLCDHSFMIFVLKWTIAVSYLYGCQPSFSSVTITPQLRHEQLLVIPHQSALSYIYPFIPLTISVVNPVLTAETYIVKLRSLSQTGTTRACPENLVSWGEWWFFCDQQTNYTEDGPALKSISTVK